MITRSALWAKIERDTAGHVARWHSLVHHSADVAAVMAALLDQPTIAARLSLLAGRSGLCRHTKIRLSALAFLHDIGKANRGFRARIDLGAPSIGHIDTLAWLFGPDQGAVEPCARLCAVLGLDRLWDWFGDQEADLFASVFAHHGRPWKPCAPSAAKHWEIRAGDDPIADLAPMRASLDLWFGEAFDPAPKLPAAPGFVHAYAGLVMLADWLGSDREFFPFADGDGPDRMSSARAGATAALEQVGLAVEQGRAASRPRGLGFSRLFGGISPRSVQEESIKPTSQLVVLEAETGSGKTEAALWRFAHLFHAGAVDGLYFALPTRVAASQMFDRLRRFRDGLFGPDGPAVLRAVPGQIGIDDAEGRKLPAFGFEWSDDPDGGTRRARWAAEHPKRFLAAQLAVGTIDQALMAALAIKHAHLRGSTLLRHLLVVDEVHASDTYMEGLLVALLRAHLDAGGHALLLSATLGGAARAQLLGTARPTLEAAEKIPYPVISWADTGDEKRQRIAPATRQPKTIIVEPARMLDDPSAIAALALDAAALGARVLVVRNTVGGAVAVQRALEEQAGADHPCLFRVAGRPTLHHGRFAPTDRRLLDRDVEKALGKGRPGGGLVVIGTQTLEQSLDLDADLLLTDLCPMDVLLQRIGRLHRHQERPRPPGFETPLVHLLVPAERDLVALAKRGRHGLGAFVYEDLRVIEATWRLVEAYPEWRIPDMNRLLVERATHPEVLEALWDELSAEDPAWGRHIVEFTGRDRQHGLEAGLSIFDRAAPFRKFKAADSRLATRLGGADRHLEFDHPPQGPFGVPVLSIRVPSYRIDGVAPEATPTVTAIDTGSFEFSLATLRFRYDRFGLASIP